MDPESPILDLPDCTAGIDDASDAAPYDGLPPALGAADADASLHEADSDDGQHRPRYFEQEHDSIHAASLSLDDESFSRSALGAGLTPIVDGVLYLGSAKDAGDAAACAALGIGAYLCVAKEVALPAHVAVSDAPVLHLP
eukprot:CAMPEP_0174832848 /NCGR_PEP_ID=MMETSP1114-20130205/3891_1 /TAXON_ID=312471 /ORGANISM="Neobodo designis, Strain CCAP 1951/1" /LENGTH=139 /DNA_ID=CAMNT_0016066715 /DNA_START=90 /DNA_END=505 /DNA_ORIENTATION=+